MSTPTASTPITHLIQAVIDGDMPAYLAALRDLMETVGVVHLVTELCLLVNTLGRDAHGDDWQSVVSTASHFIEMAATEVREGEGR